MFPTMFPKSLAFVLGCALLIAQASGAGGLPEDWETHDDPLGFTISHPGGWSVDTPGDELIRVSSEDGYTFALIYPFQLSRAMTTEEFVDGLPEELASYLPDARVEGYEQIYEAPDQAVASLSYDAEGDEGYASLICVIDDVYGMLFVAAAPEYRLDEDQDDLIGVLGSFAFGEPENPISYDMSFVSWEDPNFGAFSLDVPEGWFVDGGSYILGPGDIRAGVEIADPEGSIGITCGDPQIPLYVSAYGQESYGLVEGAAYSPYLGAFLKPKEYMTGAEYARAYVEKLADESGLTDYLTFTYEGGREDLTDAVNEAYDSYGVDVEADAGEVYFIIDAAGQEYRGYCMAMTQYIGDGPEYCIWQVGNLVGYMSLASREPIAQEVMNRAVSSFQVNTGASLTDQSASGDEGYLDGQGDDIDVEDYGQGIYGDQLGQLYPDYSSGYGTDPYSGSGSTTPGYSGLSLPSLGDLGTLSTYDATDELMDSYQRRSAEMDEMSHRVSNTILGYEDVMNPDTGEVYQVESGSNYYWLDSQGDAWGTNTADVPTPAIDFTALEAVPSPADSWSTDYSSGYE